MQIVEQRHVGSVEFVTLLPTLAAPGVILHLRIGPHVVDVVPGDRQRLSGRASFRSVSFRVVPSLVNLVVTEVVSVLYLLAEYSVVAVEDRPGNAFSLPDNLAQGLQGGVEVMHSQNSPAAAVVRLGRYLAVSLSGKDIFISRQSLERIFDSLVELADRVIPIRLRRGLGFGRHLDL